MYTEMLHHFTSFIQPPHFRGDLDVMLPYARTILIDGAPPHQGVLHPEVHRFMLTFDRPMIEKETPEVRFMLTFDTN
jgi:hypothetical protein